MKTKQVIVIRKDLNMRKGKMIAQGSHASMAFITKYLRVDEPFQINNTEMTGWEVSVNVNNDWVRHNLDPVEVKDWLENSFTKVCLYVESEEELLYIHRVASNAGLYSALITDNGLTEFHGVPTNTCIAIGPHMSDRIDVVTGHLKLL